MDVKYRVFWHSSSDAGNGDVLDFDTAIAWCDAMNKKYPNICHFALPVFVEGSPALESSAPEVDMLA